MNTIMCSTCGYPFARDRNGKLVCFHTACPKAWRKKQALLNKKSAQRETDGINLPELKEKIEEIYEANKSGNGWDAWSSLCLWLAQYESSQKRTRRFGFLGMLLRWFNR